MTDSNPSTPTYSIPADVPVAVQAEPSLQQQPEVSTSQRIEAGMAVLRNNLPGLSQGSLRSLLEKAGGDVMQALSGLTQHELSVPVIRQQVSMLCAVTTNLHSHEEQARQHGRDEDIRPAA